MKWTDAILNIPVEKGADILGNETHTVHEHMPVKVRLTNWSVEERAGLDPAYTRTTRKCIFRGKHLRADSITIDGADYQIIENYDLGRWQLLHIRSYKQ